MDNSLLDSQIRESSTLQKFRWFIVCIGILAVGIGLFVVLRLLKPVPQQRDLTADVPQVQAQILSYRDTPLYIEGTGFVVPKAAIVVSPQVAGEVVSLHPSMVSGGSLAKGEVMIQIDPRTFEANVKQARADLAAAEANLNYLEKQIVRIKSLQGKGYAPEENLDDAYSRRDQARAGLERAEAVLQTRLLELERTAIKAPFTGRLLSEDVDVGDIVSPGKELARFYASDEVEITVSLNTSDASFIPGLWQRDGRSAARRAWVSVRHGGRYYQWPGYLHRVESDLDRTTRTIDVVVRVPDPFVPGELISGANIPGSDQSTLQEPPPLLVGMYSNVHIEGMELDRHFVIPIEALRPNNTIWVVPTEGVLSVEPVEFVRQEGNFAVLRALPSNADNLVPGTPIIVSDIALVTDGMRVNVIPQAQSNTEEGTAMGASVPVSSKPVASNPASSKPVSSNPFSSNQSGGSSSEGEL